MTKRMLIDASHAEETRVVVLDGNRLEEFDIETENKRPLKGNIYLAKVVRVEPSLQAAFVEYGGNRHGFLAFGEIHPDYYQIPVADRERLLALQAEEAQDEEEDEVSDAEADEMVAAIERMADADEAGEASEPGEPRSQAMSSGESRSADPEALLAAEAAAAEATVPHEGVAIGEPADGPAPELPAAELSAAETAEAEENPPETLGGRGKEESDENGREERRIPPRFLRHYKIQEVIRRRQIMLVQVVKEERGNKGAALTTYISLAGRFSVLMPNSPKGGGISRKITSIADRKRLREAIDELNMPRGMSMIVRTAGAGLPKPEIRRDCEYLLRLWDDIRERTLQSTAPALIYEEADLIKRSIRDVFGRDIEEIQVEGEGAYRQARDFMRMLMPQNERKIRLYRDATVPLFARHGVDAQLDAMMSPTVQLKSGGYIVINQTEALVAIDVNSGRATRDRHIEDTALRTNMEAAEEIARQLRLRDLAGLIVIDFIDMESPRNDAQVERRLKEALKNDRARIQVGRISHFGLLEMSRQRLRPSLTEHSFITCPHCQGLGIVRSPESAALQVLRQIEEEGAKRRAAEIQVSIAPDLALHILNRRRDRLSEIEARYNMAVLFEGDAKLSGPQIRIERLRAQTAPEPQSAPAALRMDFAPEAEPERAETGRAENGRAEPARAEAVATPEAAAGARPEVAGEAAPANGEEDRNGDGRRRRRRRRRRGGRREDGTSLNGAAESESEADEGEEEEGDAAEATAEAIPAAPLLAEEEPDVVPDFGGEFSPRDGAEPRSRRRGRRGGRRREGEAPRPEAGQPPRQDRRPETRHEPRAEGRPEPRQGENRAARYAGPTPADPFAGTLDDIFDAMAAAEEAAQQASLVKPVPLAQGPAPQPVAAPVVVEPAPAAPEPAAAVPEAAPPAAPEPAAAAQAEPAPEPVAEAPAAKPRRASRSRKAAVAEPAAEAAPEAAPVAAPEAVPEAAAEAPAKPRRASRSRKAAVAEPAAEAVPEAQPEAAAEPAAEAPAKPRRAPRSRKPVAAPSAAELPAEQPAPVVEAPVTAPVAAAAPAAAEPAAPEPAAPAPAAGEPVAAPPVQPVIVEASPDAPKKRGWWKR
ncbi:ribonuclease E/G [Pseudoroseomonas cervicalis]|uniref:Rne/Rng family ribonuclease n=1 Tax=Teichococcus cervicalis TaxID=204525 RepID=UPI002781914E|nr:ribonuclease E/G [Pseudoroseomonas cervicalis]MDQ1080167.1 ribonuclease E [Pseudoroseomonas cervicalis]